MSNEAKRLKELEKEGTSLVFTIVNEALDFDH